MGIRDQDHPLTSLGICSRCLVIMLSILILIVGAVVSGLGLYFLLHENEVSGVMGHAFMTIVAAVLVVAGFMMILAGIVGLASGISLNKGLMIAYILMMTLICLLLLGGAIMAFAFKTQINEEVRSSMLKSLHVYGARGKEHVTRSWDRVQEQLYCCGVDEQSWPEYRKTPWFQETPGEPGYSKPFVPLSCCARNQYGEYINKQKCQYTENGPPGVKNVNDNEALHYQGCLTGAKRHAEEYFSYAAGIGLGVLVVIILALLFGVLLLIQRRKY